jgi:hypothetical protein
MQNADALGLFFYTRGRPLAFSGVRCGSNIADPQFKDQDYLATGYLGQGLRQRPVGPSLSATPLLGWL